MKREYDFSKGERGKFYQKDAVFNIPIYLEPEVKTFIENIAEKKKKNIQDVVNSIIRENIKLSKTLSA
ncbi:MAG: hypothetical protein A2X61_14145 [Ignavibacteria bacterium GWB2_35_12]|nr:MAG: hypothetical protein A2X63_10500 [Ignavibacteria bacterium GWA2_35_8]OGU41247.1 MAG: hypothetical protein A2X61_14145 [Ignavibacteria bacterium GWB2_35_12]OGU96219.1 MAG: hypothetical protein A2220_12545 [Ignavibacteria bacterium RIFOXYA2_FULL_35_10]OGV23170.1 MAG: hypothetical protein A2475_17475 [Ignavibacteria bacterium RIFOXYC2_FULL_35_21]